MTANLKHSADIFELVAVFIVQWFCPTTTRYLTSIFCRESRHTVRMCTMSEGRVCESRPDTSGFAAVSVSQADQQRSLCDLSASKQTSSQHSPNIGSHQAASPLSHSNAVLGHTPISASSQHLVSFSEKLASTLYTLAQPTQNTGALLPTDIHHHSTSRKFFHYRQASTCLLPAPCSTSFSAYSIFLSRKGPFVSLPLSSFSRLLPPSECRSISLDHSYNHILLFNALCLCAHLPVSSCSSSCSSFSSF